MERQIKREWGRRRGTGSRERGTLMGDLKTPEKQRRRQSRQRTGARPPGSSSLFWNISRKCFTPVFDDSGDIFSFTRKGQRRFGVRQAKTHVPALLASWVILRDSLNHLSLIVLICKMGSWDLCHAAGEKRWYSLRTEGRRGTQRRLGVPPPSLPLDFQDTGI